MLSNRMIFLCGAVILLLASSANAAITCFELPADDPNVCSGQGVCIDIDTCLCDPGYSGDECSIPSCFGLPGSDPGVCSGNGTCVDLDFCSCEPGYLDRDCSVIACFGLPSSHPDVCSAHGICIDADTCACEPGYVGDDCLFPTCFGVASYDPGVCSGNGTCVAPDTCVCDQGCVEPICEPESVPCEQSGFPTCGGECPAGLVCTAAPGISACECREPPPVPALGPLGLLGLSALVLMLGSGALALGHRSR